MVIIVEYPNTLIEKNMNSVKMNNHRKPDENFEIVEFINQITVSEEEAEFVIKNIVADLKSTFKADFPYECLPFGSYVNGLRCKDSDVDVCLRIEPLISSEKPKPTLNRVKKYLYGNKSFSSIVCIPKAKVPIVKFKHINTSVECDLSLDNEVGVQNTFLVKSYLSMNTNLKFLVLLLKHLLAKYDLRGTCKFTTYILFWLVVFYMQQLDLLPPVMNAREFTAEQRIICGWNCSVPQPFSTPKNDPFSLRYHLQKFCEFYSNFDYTRLVICPYLACEISVKNLDQLKLPQEFFASYLDKIRDGTASPFASHVINVQDPTSLNVNLTRPISPSIHYTFKVFCSKINEFLCKNNTNDKFIELLYKMNPKSLPLKNFSLNLAIPNKIKKRKKKMKMKSG